MVELIIIFGCSIAIFIVLFIMLIIDLIFFHWVWPVVRVFIIFFGGIIEKILLVVVVFHEIILIFHLTNFVLSSTFCAFTVSFFVVF